MFFINKQQQKPCKKGFYNDRQRKISQLWYEGFEHISFALCNSCYDCWLFNSKKKCWHHFMAEGSSSMPFTLREMVPMSLALRNACLGIIELAHPDAKFSINEDYRQALHKTGIKRKQNTEQEDKKEARLWAFLFKVSKHSWKRKWTLENEWKQMWMNSFKVSFWFFIL